MSHTDYLYPNGYYPPVGDALPTTLEPVSQDYRKLVGCLWVTGVVCALAGMMYMILGDPMIPAGIAGTVVIVLALYHTPFGLFVLFSCFAIENAVVLGSYFTISKAMGIVVALSFLMHVFRDKLVVTTPLKVAAAFVAWALASSLWSEEPEYTAMTCLGLVLNAALILIVLNSIKDQKSLYLVLCGFAAGALVTSCMVVAGYQAQSSQRAVDRATLSEETNTLVLALATGLGVLATCYTFFQKGRFKKVVALVLLALFFLAMVRTQSRMPMIASFAAPVIALILVSEKQHRLKYFIVAILAAALAYLAIQTVLQSNLLTDAEKQRIFSEGLEESGRLRFWAMGLKTFAFRPLHGYGTNNYFLVPGHGGRSAHNTFVALAVDLGLVGLGLALTVFFLLYRQVKSLSDIRLRWLGLAMLLYPLMTGTTVTNYLKREFWYPLAITMAVVNIGKRQEQQPGGQL